MYKKEKKEKREKGKNSGLRQCKKVKQGVNNPKTVINYKKI
jgi:hypothetical protein